MFIALLILIAIVLPATMLVLTLSMNEFEKNARALGTVLIKRYTMEPSKKFGDQAKGVAIMKAPTKT